MEELKSKIVWQEDKDFGKVCTLTESALNGIIAEATKGLEQQIEELEKQLEICETNVDTYYDELTKLQEQLIKTTQIGMTCSNCKWSQYDEDEMCYCCSNKDKWELKLRR